MKNHILIFLFSIILSSCSPSLQPSVLDTNPELFSRTYTPQNINEITEAYKNNPLTSQEYGNLVLWKIHEKSPEFAYEMAKQSDIMDGISPKEADALESILEIIEPIEFTPDFYRKLDDGINKVLLTVENPTKRDLSYNGEFFRKFASFGTIVQAQPMSFEESDSIDHVFEGDNNSLKWKMILPPGDSDSILLHIQYPNDGNMIISTDLGNLSFFQDELKKEIEIGHLLNYGLSLTLKDVNMEGIDPVKYAVRDMVLYGGENHASSLMDSLLFGYASGHFKKGENPLKEYSDAKAFLKPVWDQMWGTKWKDVEDVSHSVNTIDLFRFWANTYMRYEMDVGTVKTPNQIMKRRLGDCDDMVRLGIAILRPNGINITPVSQDNHKHFVGVARIGDSYFDVINWNLTKLANMAKGSSPGAFGQITSWNPKRSLYR